MRMLKKIFFTFFTVLCMFNNVPALNARVHYRGGDMGMGMPFGGDSEIPGISENPAAVHVVQKFLSAWANQDWAGMYELLDPEVKRNYSLEQAEFDFQMIEYYPYEISSVTRSDGKYEFILSFGDWRYGDKKTQKMLLNAETIRILMPTDNSFFVRSLIGFF